MTTLREELARRLAGNRHESLVETIREAAHDRVLVAVIAFLLSEARGADIGASTIFCDEVQGAAYHSDDSWNPTGFVLPGPQGEFNLVVDAGPDTECWFPDGRFSFAHALSHGSSSLYDAAVRLGLVSD